MIMVESDLHHYNKYHNKIPVSELLSSYKNYFRRRFKHCECLITYINITFSLITRTLKMQHAYIMVHFLDVIKGLYASVTQSNWRHKRLIDGQTLTVLTELNRIKPRPLAKGDVNKNLRYWFTASTLANQNMITPPSQVF